MSCELELQGVEEVLAKLEQLGRKGNAAISRALETGAEPILEELKKTTVFDDRSGDLRDAQKVSGIKTRKGIKYVWVGDVDRECPYAWNLEFGHSRASARPYMRDAWARKKREAQSRIKEELRKELSKIE